MTVNRLSGKPPARTAALGVSTHKNLTGRGDDVPPKVINPTLGKRLTTARKAAGITQADLASIVGMNQTAIAEIEGGRVRRPKKLREIARAVGRSEEYLLGEDDDQRPPTSPHLRFAEVAEVPVVGKVEAGVFRVVEGFDDALPSAIVVVARDPRFPRARLYAFEVQGDSMDAVGILPGDLVITADFIDAGLPLRDGMTVVAECTRDGGHTVERTLKEVATFKDRVELVPRSTNKKHQKFVIKPNYDPSEPSKSEDGAQIKVLAVVLRVNKELAV
jgi:SOS-response transcriptional repressor LexA